MLILNRRDFLKNATAFGALAATGIARGASDEVGKPYPGWKPGEMDLHFVYTGCGDVNYEGLVGERVGPVTVCKMNHHGCSDSMDEAFVKQVRAQAYVACMWCPGQLAPKTLRTISKYADPAILPNLMPAKQCDKEIVVMTRKALSLVSMFCTTAVK